MLCVNCFSLASAVGLLAQASLDESFCLAIVLGTVGFGEGVLDAQCLASLRH